MKIICILAVCILGAVLNSPAGALPLGNKAISRIYVPPRTVKRSPAVNTAIPGAPARHPLAADHKDLAPNAATPAVAHEQVVPYKPVDSSEVVVAPEHPTGQSGGIATAPEQATIAQPTGAGYVPVVLDSCPINNSKEELAQPEPIKKTDKQKQEEARLEKQSIHQNELELKQKAVAVQKAQRQKEQTDDGAKKLQQDEEKKKLHQNAQSQKYQGDEKKVHQAAVHVYRKPAAIKAHSQKHPVGEKKKTNAKKIKAAQRKNEAAKWKKIAHTAEKKAQVQAKWQQKVKTIVRKVRELKKQKKRQRVQAVSEKKVARIGAMGIYQGYGNFEIHH